MNTAQEVANLITDLIQEKEHLSVNKMLKDCGLKKGVVDSMKLNSMPAADKLATIAAYLGVSTDYLLGNENTNEKESKNMEKELEKFANLPLYEKYRAYFKESGLPVKDFISLSCPKRTTLAAYQDLIEGGQFDELKSIEKLEMSETLEKYRYSINDIIVENPTPTTISILLKRARCDAKKSISDIATLVGVDEISVISWESGERVPTERLFALLDSALNFCEEDRKRYINARSQNENSKGVASGNE